MESKKFASNSGLYLISSVLAQGINLLLMSIYTRNITTSEFGQYNLVNSLQSLLSIVITLGIFSGLSRFFNECEDKNKLKNIALTFSILWGIICCFVVGYLLNNVIAYFVFKDDILGGYYIRYIILNSTLACLIAIYTSYYSMMYKAKKVCFINIGQIILTLIFTCYYLLIVKFGILGIYKAQSLSLVIVFVIVFIMDIKNYKIILSRKELKSMLGYGIGLAPGQISSWILTLIDRYFIKGMMNLNAVAVYSMGYKIGMLIDPVFIIPFKSSFTPFKFSVYKEADGKERIKKVFSYFNFISWFVILGISIFSDITIKILSTSEYSESYKVVGIIAFSCYLWGLAEFYAIGIHIANKMVFNSLIVTVSAVLNVLLNYFMIPMMGIYGAAIATCISYLVANILYYIVGKKYYDLNVNLMEPYKCGFIFAVLYCMYFIYKHNINNVAFELLLNIVICIVYIILCIKLNIIELDNVKKIFSMFKNKLGSNKNC